MGTTAPLVRSVSSRAGAGRQSQVKASGHASERGACDRYCMAEKWGGLRGSGHTQLGNLGWRKE